ncbi:DUF4192 domain-containing protein [Glycomyces sp. NPDC046736]|uniref:DUF4192 domain-containing protein n=1 Tax=Glycomyces sp. NPDC046736 TaxID=3155615 RepID=UPI0033CB4796
MNATQTSIRIKGPTDLLTVIPPLLGFHPSNSLVVSGLVDSRLECTFRAGLPGSTDHMEHLTDLSPQLELNNCNGCVIVAYGEKELAEASIAHAAALLDRAGIEPKDLLRVTEGRWYSLTCDKPCCPAEGLPVPETSAASCEIAIAGAYAAPNRAAIQAGLAPAPTGRRAAVSRAVCDKLTEEAGLDWSGQRSADLRAIDHWMAAKTLPGPADIAAVGLALGDLDIRDYAVRRISSGEFESNRIDLWIWVARHMEEDLRAPAATVAGYAAYRSGNGVLALECFELALRSAPNYRLAQLLMAALQAGYPPSALTKVGYADREEAEVGN